jgi:hypothetical protein
LPLPLLFAFAVFVVAFAALNCPLLGRHSDPERSRRGRIPVFVFAVAFVFAVTFFVLGLAFGGSAGL